MQNKETVKTGNKEAEEQEVEQQNAWLKKRKGEIVEVESERHRSTKTGKKRSRESKETEKQKSREAKKNKMQESMLSIHTHTLGAPLTVGDQTKSMRNVETIGLAEWPPFTNALSQISGKWRVVQASCALAAPGAAASIPPTIDHFPVPFKHDIGTPCHVKHGAKPTLGTRRTPIQQLWGHGDEERVESTVRGPLNPIRILWKVLKRKPLY